MADATIEIPITTDASKFVRETARATKSLFELEKAEFALNEAKSILTSTYERFIKAQVDAVRKTDELAKTSALSIRTVAALGLAARNAGLQMEDVVPKGLADRLADLREGTQSVVDDFGLLGLTQRDFERINYDLDASLALILDRLRDTSPINRAAAATRLLEGEGEKLIAVLSGGSDQLEEFKRAAAEIGPNTDEARKATGELSVALAQLDTTMQEVGATITQLLSDTGVPGLIEDFARGTVYAVNAVEGSIDGLLERLSDPKWYGLNAITFGLYGVMDALANGWPAATENARGALNEFDRANRRTGQTFRVVGEELEPLVFGLEQVPEALRGAEGAAKKTEEAVVKQAEQMQIASLAWDGYGASVASAAAIQLAAVQGVGELERQIREQAAADELTRLEEAGAARRAAAMEAIRLAEQMRASQIAAQESVVANAQAAAGSIVSLAQGTQGRMRGVLIAVATAERALAVARTLFQVGPAYAQGVSAAPPPAGFILGGANAAAVLAQAAATAAAPLPKFHRGRAMEAGPDEVPAMLHRTEAVLTAEAVQQLNAGRGVGGSEPAIVVLDHVSVGRAVTRALRDPRSEVYEAVRRDLPGHSRRRR